MKSLKDVIGENITRIIKDSVYSAREIAAKLNVSETTLHRWKTGENPPDVANLEALAKLLKVDPSEFYKGGENVVPIYGNTPLKKYMVIPDEIVEGLSHFSPDSPIWEKLQDTIDLQKKLDELSRTQLSKGSAVPESEK